jgi:hypothetical protein
LNLWETSEAIRLGDLGGMAERLLALSLYCISFPPLANFHARNQEPQNKKIIHNFSFSLNSLVGSDDLLMTTDLFG